MNSAPENCDELEEFYNFMIEKAEKILLVMIGALPFFYGRAFADPLLHMALNPKIRYFIFCKRKVRKVFSPEANVFHNQSIIKHPSIFAIWMESRSG